jgi:hypothetical protein
MEPRPASYNKLTMPEFFTEQILRLNVTVAIRRMIGSDVRASHGFLLENKKGLQQYAVNP